MSVIFFYSRVSGATPNDECYLCRHEKRLRVSVAKAHAIAWAGSCYVRLTAKSSDRIFHVNF